MESATNSTILSLLEVAKGINVETPPHYFLDFHSYFYELLLVQCTQQLLRVELKKEQPTVKSV